MTRIMPESVRIQQGQSTNSVQRARCRRLYAAARTVELSKRCDERCRGTARAIALLALDRLAKARGAG